MGVFVPGTGKIGLAIAAAAGAIAGLEVLATISAQQVLLAQEMIDAGKVSVKRTVTDEFIYCCVVAKFEGEESLVKISGGHTLIVEKQLNGNINFIYIKSHYPHLSAFCGNTVTSAAASTAMVYLAGGSFEQSCFSIQNVISDSSGMICDGAKASCAMKVSTSSCAAVRAFLMAMNSGSVSGQGIIAKDVEQTIINIGQMISHGMSSTDTTIINIMSA